MGQEVELVWLGHACFALSFKGKRLVIDPHDGESIGVGIPRPAIEADYILVSHEHYDHNAVEVVSSPSSTVVRERLGEFILEPFRIKGVKLPHDEFEGRIRGHVVAYVVNVAGIRIAHLSDLGRMLKEEEAGEIGVVDIALIPAGGVYTLHPRQALDVALQIKAKMVIPMHYWLPGVHLPLEPLEVLLRYAKKWKIIRIDSNKIKVSIKDIPQEPSIVILTPPRR